MTTARTLALPRLVPSLSILAGALLAVYVALMVTTILFAALQTDLAQQVQDKRMQVAKLETRYYDDVASLDDTNPQSLGFVTPDSVQYVTAVAPQNLTFAR
jgi:hypothetical protein